MRLDHINIQTRAQLINRNTSTLSDDINWVRINHFLTIQHADRHIVGAGAGHGPGLRFAAHAGHATGLHAGDVDAQYVLQFHAVHGSVVREPGWG